MCGETDVDMLTIDHTAQDGAEHRREVGMERGRGGSIFYQWLKDKDYPDGYRVLCFNHNIKVWLLHQRAMRL